MVQDCGERLFDQRFKGSRVTKELSHRDEDVVEERVHLRGPLLDQCEITLKLGFMAQRHAARKPSGDRCQLVMGEVHARSGMQQSENPL